MEYDGKKLNAISEKITEAFITSINFIASAYGNEGSYFGDTKRKTLQARLDEFLSKENLSQQDLLKFVNLEYSNLIVWHGHCSKGSWLSLDSIEGHEHGNISFSDFVGCLKSLNGGLEESKQVTLKWIEKPHIEENYNRLES
ncbi:hypothetical protein L3V86_04895 [Thiotrichales bacterium 19S11-10]|nr:hypothetical protein [Thiotrichales bacterium 19S11-10]